MVKIGYSPNFQRHVTPYMHPEQVARTEVVYQALKPLGLEEIQIRPASIEDVARVHTPSYIQLVQNECAQLEENALAFLSTGDVTICPDSYDTALLAAGSCLSGADAIMRENEKFCFIICRPPGHHATPDKGMGFCLFNNAAIACRYIQARYHIKRVLIVDWDVHHGNGTQDIFYNDPTVFYFSTHQEGIYPGTGRPEERGVGNILNCPIPTGASSAILEAFRNKLLPAMDAFNPEFIIISAGFDAHKDDPVGGLSLTEEDFSTLSKIIQELADNHKCRGVLSILEGGYNLSALASSALAHIKTFIN